MKVLSAEVNLETPTNLGNSTVVRVYNSDSSVGTITKKDVTGNILGTMTVPSGEVVYCEKKYTDTLEGGVTLKASQIAYSNMMYYASAAIAEGPDTTNPSLTSSSPANNATLVAVDSNIILNFSEPVDAVSGNIVIYKESDDSVIESINVTSGQVTGSGTNQITINPSSDLTTNTTFYIQIAATAFDDASGNSYAGISDKTSLSFTTAAYVTDNLVFHIDAGDTNSYSGSGTTVNSLVGSITNSSYNSNISYSTSDGGYWTFGSNTGDGIEFDSITSFMPLGTNDMTYEIWLNTVSATELAAANYPTIGAFGLTRLDTNGYKRATFYHYYFLSPVIGHYLGFKKSSSASGGYTEGVHTQSDYDNSQWNHLVISHDVSVGKPKYYYNGSEVSLYMNSSYSWNTYYNNSNDQYQLNVGSNNMGDDKFRGKISILRIYKGKALTSSEVTQNFNAEKARYGYS